MGDSGRPPTLPASPSLQEEPAAAGRGDFAAGFAFSEKEAAAGAASGAWVEALGQLKRKVGNRDRGRGRWRPRHPHLSALLQRCATSLDEKIATVRRQRRAQVRSRSQRRLRGACPGGASLREREARWARGFGPNGCAGGLSSFRRRRRPKKEQQREIAERPPRKMRQRPGIARRKRSYSQSFPQQMRASLQKLVSDPCIEGGPARRHSQVAGLQNFILRVQRVL